MLEAMLSRPGFIVMDGGMGTTLEDRGVSVRNDLWSSTALLDPQGIALNDGVHADFAAAGAELLIANTHNASLAHGKVRAQFERINRAAGESALRAQPKIVAAGICSAEPAYSTESKMTPHEVIEKLAPQAELLSTLPIDLLLFETISTRSEVEGIGSLLETIDVPVGVGLSCNDQGTTHGGVNMRDVATILEKTRLFFIQCTRYDLVERPLDELLEHVGDPRRVGVYANDGRRWIDRRWHGDRISPEMYASYASRWMSRNIAIIGGCCGTSPEHIAALARMGV
jgi:S-methylmethionine-dependent homocysteine/selenocysteine methylase